VIRDCIEPELYQRNSPSAMQASYRDPTIEMQRSVWERLPYTLIVVGAKPEG
jgi:hypothetical protein